MKVKYLGETDPLALTKGEVYDVIAVEYGPANTKWYRIALENDDDDGSGVAGYLYSENDFAIMND